MPIVGTFTIGRRQRGEGYGATAGLGFPDHACPTPKALAPVWQEGSGLLFEFSLLPVDCAAWGKPLTVVS